jgi:hypothetical protein
LAANCVGAVSGDLGTVTQPVRPMAKSPRTALLKRFMKSGSRDVRSNYVKSPEPDVSLII